MLASKEVYEMLGAIAAVFEERKQELSGYDAVIGDGDHGYSLARGNKAAWAKVEALGPQTPVPELFKQYGRELTCEIGGAMGPLFGLLFTQLGKACADTGALGLTELCTGLTSARELITELGGAQVGDKTMVDAIAPTVEALAQACAQNCTLPQGLKLAVAAAQAGLESTIPLQARRGRSKYLREKSIGHQDAGATSFCYLMKTIAGCVGGGNA